MSDVSQQIMMYAGEQLEDCKTLDCYNIKDKSMLELLPPPPQIQIFVKTWSTGKTITLDVQLTSTIKDIKRKLFDKLRIPIHLQSLVFAGKMLQENRDLASYNVQRHSTLHMVFCPRSKIIRWELSNFGSDLPLSTTISELKDIAKLKWKNPVKEIVLSGAALQDQYSLRDYRLGRDSLCLINVREVDLPAGDMGHIRGHPKLYSGLAICTSDKKSYQIDYQRARQADEIKRKKVNVSQDSKLNRKEISFGV
ncbi:hypothetical protein LWI29_026299 [Acer saccharum]|uniref:Ubiquitin-like domain-containing protein n=1 Tax=Acer saccharum TaxID=4024 RepID=A0AA39TDT4_ACESA|nr:hypothetical protein LWI29_026299 [Acer saccharum]